MRGHFFRESPRLDAATKALLNKAYEERMAERLPEDHVEHCSAIPCHSMLWRDVTLQFVLYFDIVFDVIACT